MELNFEFEKVKKLIAEISDAINSITDINQKVELLNYCRQHLHQVSPFKDNPVDFVEWVPAEKVRANDYNPNQVAPPEMKLLKISIDEDGYTQPIVSDKVKENDREVVDGFHRNRIGKEYKDVRKRLHGYLPIVTIRNSQRDKKNRIAATIRHNRARGTHSIRGMSDIVLSLLELGWDDERIGKYLGMEAEEVVRLKQITGLPQAFGNHEFSKSWEEFESKLPKE
jgi:ParB-like chromosome segregation protein Spo0J